jgi:hypothetical protein
VWWGGGGGRAPPVGIYLIVCVYVTWDGLEM